MDHQRRPRVADNVLKFGDGEAGVQRQENRADTSARELHLQRISGVHRKHRDPVTATYLEPIAQVGGETRNARVELCVGKAAFAGEVDDRQFVRRPAAEMGNPVIVANGQNLLHVSGLAPPDLLDLTPYSSVERW